VRIGTDWRIQSWYKRAGTRRKSNPLIHKRLVLLLLVLFLSSHGSTAAQTPASRIVPMQARVTPMTAKLPQEFTPARTASYLLSGNPGKPNPHFSSLSARAYERDLSLKDLSSSVDNVKTAILKQSSMPLIQLLGGRLQLNTFQSTFQIQSVPLNPFGNCGIQHSFLRRQTYPRSLCSADLSGVSLSFQFGRDARIERPVQGWRRLIRVAGAALN
jgi:hypothetical protein